MMEWLVRGQGPHFKTFLMKELGTEMRIKHHFTTAYRPRADKTVEGLCREVLRIARALLSE